MGENLEKVYQYRSRFEHVMEVTRPNIRKKFVQALYQDVRRVFRIPDEGTDMYKKFGRYNRSTVKLYKDIKKEYNRLCGIVK